jgi:predicted dehydrogenase
MPNRYEDSQNGESGVELELFETRSRVIDHFVDSTITVPANDPYRDELGAFLSAVERGKRPGVNDIEEAIQVQHVLDRVHEASSRSA